MLRDVYKLPSVRWLVVANLTTMLSVCFFGGLQQLTAVYWWEMSIIWIFSFARLAVISPLYLLAMFVLLFIGAGFFMVFFTFALAYAGHWDLAKKHLTELTVFAPGVLISVIPLLFSHAYSFYQNFWPNRESYRGPGTDACINKFVRYPYQRAAMWAVVITISFVVAGSLRAAWLAYFFIGLFKIIADIWSHVTLNDLANPDLTPEAKPCFSWIGRALGPVVGRVFIVRSGT
ncbi:MAG TPA: hypothetical protein DCL44_00775 [Elusimicrobia bacterium]|nr:hypothetical protein [Elusimicrobiota bacterium]